MNRKTILLSVTIAVIAGSVLAAGFALNAAASPGRVMMTTPPGIGHADRSTPMQTQPRTQYNNNNNNPSMLPSVPNTPPMSGWNQNSPGGQGMFAHGNYSSPQRGPRMNGRVSININSTQAKSVVEADIPNLKVGAPTSLRAGWIVPVEDAKGVVTLIQVTTVSANTSDQAKNLVEQSLAKGWTAGDPKLMGVTYFVPLLDSNNTAVSYARVDGRSGAIITTPSLTPTVTSAQAKTIVNNAIKNFTVGAAKDAVSAWIVTIQYENKTVMTVILGKINTPTSNDAVTAVKDSLQKGWSAGNTTQTRLTYNVSIIDSNGNTIGNIIVNGRTGAISGFLNNPKVGVTGGARESPVNNNVVVDGNAL